MMKYCTHRHVLLFFVEERFESEERSIPVRNGLDIHDWEADVMDT